MGMVEYLHTSLNGFKCIIENMKVSFILPIYNVEKYLSECVESILAQTYRDFEILLVDDGSPDNCPALCDEWAKRIIV